MANGTIKTGCQSEVVNDDVEQPKDRIQFTQKYFRNQVAMTSAPANISYYSENKGGWSGRWWKVGTGLNKFGQNSCYLNATLQALFHVPAFAKWLSSATESLHAEKCIEVHCLICSIRSTFIHCQRSRFAITPYNMHYDLHLLGQQFKADKKLDAYEFLQCLFDSLQVCYIDRYNLQIQGTLKFNKTYYTNPIKQIFEGQMRTFLNCEKCDRFSFQDSAFNCLVTEVDYFKCLEEVLEYYFTKKLVKSFCIKCERQVTATEQRYILKEPSVLCVVIDRFSASGVKSDEFLSFEPTVSMRQYMLVRQYRSPHRYRFRSSINHYGPSIEDGRYNAVAVDDLQTFYEFANEKVTSIPRWQALEQCICVVFYEKECDVLEEPY